MATEPGAAAYCSRCGYPRTRTACARCLYVEPEDQGRVVTAANRWEPVVLPGADAGELPPVGECLACGHRMPLAVWRDGTDIGLCTPCRDAALPLRGPCSTERGCRCVRA